MSRIGKKPVAIPAGVNVELAGRELKVKGPKGLLAMTVLEDVNVKVDGGAITITPANDSKRARARWGMQRTLAANLVEGVTKGFSHKLEVSGVGYRAAVQGKTLRLQLGFSHDVNYPIPQGIDIKCPDQTTIEISGIDKQRVGQVAAEIRAYRKPEPYKGKGIRYAGEYVFRKEGKKK
ncbi:MAG: 50S ribosomal protein L6 [Alphaproteobacteria bacterium]|nr:MAG: 50S ribosomal protein L6 [Alphaproteobacteria bacterium]